MQQEQISQNFNVAPEEEINFRRILYVILNKWHWLLISVCIALIGSYFYGKSNRQVYSATATILVPKDKNAFDLQSIFEDKFGEGTSEIANEIEMLRSYTLNSRTIEKLNWRTSWYQKSYFKTTGLYGHEPFNVELAPDSLYFEDLLIDVEMVSNTEFVVSADGEAMFLENWVDIDFSGRGKIGEWFKNQYCHLKLSPHNGTVPTEGQQFQFVFHNMNTITKLYQQKITAELTDVKSDVIRISVEGEEPLREVHFVNELIDNYLVWKLQLQTQMQKRSLDFVEQQLTNFADSLDTASDAFSNFRSQNQILDLSLQGQLVMEQLGESEKQILQEKAKLDYYNNLVTYLRQTTDGRNLVLPSVAGIEDMTLNNMVMRLSELYSRRETVARTAKENSPSLSLMESEIAELKGQLRENLNSLIQNTQLALKSLERHNQEIAAKLNKLPGQEQRLIHINRRYELMGELYDLMLQKRAEFEIALASAVVNIHVIDPARIQNVEEKGQTNKMIYLLAFVLGLAIPVVIILSLELFDSKIHIQEDVEKMTSLNILGHVLRNTGNNELMVVEDPASAMSESLRSVRTNIKYVLSEADQKVIGIHSMSPGEGKTFIAVNLASIIAMNGHKTLLIGTDMRKPRLADILGITKENGLSTYLANLATIDEVVRETSVENLWVVAAGPKPPNPAELLERQRFEDLLVWAKKEFDYIIIDNSPVSLVTDGFVTGKYSDVNVMVLRNGVSRKNQIKFVNQIAGKGLLPNVMIVVNDVVPVVYGYYNRYGYKYSRTYKLS